MGRNGPSLNKEYLRLFNKRKEFQHNFLKFLPSRKMRPATVTFFVEEGRLSWQRSYRVYHELIEKETIPNGFLFVIRKIWSCWVWIKINKLHASFPTNSLHIIREWNLSGEIVFCLLGLHVKYKVLNIHDVVAKKNYDLYNNF